MGDHADDALFSGLDQSWGLGHPRGWGFPRRAPTPAPKKKTNQEIFAKFTEKPIDTSEF